MTAPVQNCDDITGFLKDFRKINSHREPSDMMINSLRQKVKESISQTVKIYKRPSSHVFFNIMFSVWLTATDEEKTPYK